MSLRRIYPRVNVKPALAPHQVSVKGLSVMREWEPVTHLGQCQVWARVFIGAGMAVPRKAISQKNFSKNRLRGPNLFLQEHLHYLRRSWFDL
jgi:hypothetical protein